MADPPDTFAQLRRRMVDDLAGRGITDPAVLRAMGTVPREKFLPPGRRSAAYDDRALAAGFGQTISQPYIVALMTQALQLHADSKVLEIGTGTGYQTAILAGLARHVYTVERVATLAERASATLAELGYRNISFLEADGTLGWPQHAPFDRIIVTAAAPDVPQPLLDQLADGGRMVIPAGGRSVQELLIVTKSRGSIQRENLCSCVFVKLIGEAGWEDR